MFEKKNFILNCDVCDTRKLQEESLSKYESIAINADMIITDERSRAILNRLPVIINADEILDCEAEVEVQILDKNFEINGDGPIDQPRFLVVNGDLTVHPEAGEQFTSYRKIIVNGNLIYPRSLSAKLGHVTVGKACVCYPDDCKVLKPSLKLDSYFSLRAKENARYFIADSLYLTDPNTAVEPLLEKKMQFFTKKFIVLEEKLPAAAQLVQEETELCIIPRGYAYLQGDQNLTEKLVEKYGKRLYIDGNLKVEAGEAHALKKLEALTVTGTLSLPKELEELLNGLEVSASAIELEKGRKIKNKLQVTVDRSMLEKAPDGVQIVNCARVKIEKDIEPEQILEKLEICNCVEISCSPEQQGAVELIARNTVRIGAGEKEETNPLSSLGKLAASRVVNADRYIL